MGKNTHKGEMVLVASGYEFERKIEKDGKEWTERVFVIKSPAYGDQQKKGLEKRLKTAMEKIKELTPERGKGRRQIIEESALLEGVKKIVEVQREEKYIGKGRGSANRQKQTTEKIRYQITSVNRNETKIEETKKRFGWKAFVTNARKEQMSLSEAVPCYRREYRIERIFNRLKRRLDIAHCM